MRTRTRLLHSWLADLPLVALAFPLALGLFLSAGCRNSDETAGGKYHCPMHPTYVSNRPGDCPICNMKLVAIQDDQPGKKSGASGKAASRFHCPMHPAVVSEHPGDCPICNMKLVPIKDDPAHAPAAPAAPADAAHAGPEPGTGDVEGVTGRVAIALSPEKQQMIGLRLATVESRHLTLPVRTTATFEHDERRLARIAPRFAGWARDLKVNFTGQEVEKGQPLLTVYSPELLAAESEYWLAYQSFARVRNQPSDPQFDSLRRLQETARRKLTLWQIGDEEIAHLEQSGQPRDETLLRSPVSGHVVAKTAVEGKSFMAGETLYEIADLSHLWLRASVYEYELPLIRVGQKARVTLPYLGNRSIESAVTFAYPHIEQQTRRAEIRLEIDNPHHELRPQMWANVELDVDFGEVLAVPASALIDTGTRYVAFVQREDQHLEPREVKVGKKTDDYYQVLEGLKSGEKVVTRALFLIDSESQLKYAISGMHTH